VADTSPAMSQISRSSFVQNKSTRDYFYSSINFL
jgi:hypothetical protein